MFNKSKSNESDLLFIPHEPFLDIMNKNILYLTHTIDKCLVLLKRMQIDDDLQKQVSDFVPNPLPLEDSAQDGNTE